LSPYRVVSLLILALGPQPVKRLWARRVLGWEVDETARIGLSIHNVTFASLGPNTNTGNLNVFRNLRKLSLDEGAHLGSWNWITSANLRNPDETAVPPSTLLLGRYAAIASRHYIDCTGGVSLGAWSIIAGIRSTLLTHQISYKENRQTTSSITVGHHSFIGSNTNICPGGSIPSESWIAMGATVSGTLPQSHGLYGGTPAKLLREIDGKYFRKEEVEPEA
jgi:acetyltransferase-like isoleucine patch superfamily enzyme